MVFSVGLGVLHHSPKSVLREYMPNGQGVCLRHRVLSGNGGYLTSFSAGLRTASNHRLCIPISYLIPDAKPHASRAACSSPWGAWS